jgi:hypothetical protein
MRDIARTCAIPRNRAWVCLMCFPSRRHVPVYPRTSVGRPPRGVVLHADRFNTRPSISLVTVYAEIARLLPAPGYRRPRQVGSSFPLLLLVLLLVLLYYFTIIFFSFEAAAFSCCRPRRMRLYAFVKHCADLAFLFFPLYVS